MSEKIMTVSDFLEFEKKLIGKIEVLINKSNDGFKKRWLKSKDVRKVLGNISPGKLQEMRVKGDVSFSKIGGMLLYDYDEIVKVLENSKVQ